MKRKTVGGMEFTVLDDDEIHCEHDRTELVYGSIPVNPNGEFVKGYGRTPVSVQTVIGRRCMGCGLVISD